MAMKFGGFTPEQMGKIIPEMQGMQADEQADVAASGRFAEHGLQRGRLGHRGGVARANRF